MLTGYNIDIEKNNIMSLTISTNMNSTIFTDDEINSFTIEESICSDIKYSVGNVISNTLTLKLINLYTDGTKNSIFNNSFKSTKFEVYANYDNGTSVPLGVFYGDDVKKDSFITTITAVDRLSTITYTAKYNSLLDWDNVEHNIADIAKEIAPTSNYTVLSDATTLTIKSKPVGYTKREMLGYIAGCYGMNVRMNRKGNVEFTEAGINTLKANITPNITYSLTEQEADSVVNKMYAKIANNEENFCEDYDFNNTQTVIVENYDLSKTEPLTFIYNNAYYDNGCIKIPANDTVLNSIPESDYVKIEVITPCTIKIISNTPVSTHCDTVRYVEKTSNNEYTVTLNNFNGSKDFYIVNNSDKEAEIYNIKIYREVVLNPIEIEVDNPIMTIEASYYLWSKIKGFRYRAVNLNNVANPLIEAGDAISITNENDNTYNTVVFRQEFSYNGNFTQTIETETCSKVHEDSGARAGSIENKVEAEITEKFIEKAADKLINNQTFYNKIVEIIKNDVLYADLIKVNAIFSQNILTEQLQTNIVNYKCIPNLVKEGNIIRWQDDEHTYSCSNMDSVRGYIKMQGIKQQFIEAHLVKCSNYNKITTSEVQPLTVNDKQVYYASIIGDNNAYEYFTFINPKERNSTMTDDNVEMFKVYIRKTEREYVKLENKFILENGTYNIVTQYGVGNGTGRGIYQFSKDGDTGELVYIGREDGLKYGIKMNDTGLYLLNGQYTATVVPPMHIIEEGDNIDDIPDNHLVYIKTAIS